MGTDYVPAWNRASGARTRSASRRSRSAHHWGEVRPVRAGVAPPSSARPPPCDDAARAYATAFDEVKRLGGDGDRDADRRAPTEQTQIGIYWAYDGTPSLCAPPRLYNQITMQIAEQTRARRLSDWPGCSRSSTWRWPTRASRSGSRSTTTSSGARSRASASPTRAPGRRGLGDGNAATLAIRLLAARRAGQQPDRAELHAALPAYPSGHAGFGGALFETLRQLLRHATTSRSRSSPTSSTARRVGNDGDVRPLCPRTLHVAVAGRGRERPEPHLPRHPLVVRQDGGDRTGPPRRRHGCPGHVPAVGPLGGPGRARKARPRARRFDWQPEGVETHIAPCGTRDFKSLCVCQFRHSGTWPVTNGRAPRSSTGRVPPAAMSLSAPRPTGVPVRTACGLGRPLPRRRVMPAITSQGWSAPPRSRPMRPARAQQRSSAAAPSRRIARAPRPMKRLNRRSFVLQVVAQVVGEAGDRAARAAGRPSA